MEKVKQDDALSDLSNILGELKEMAVDMGSELDKYGLIVLENMFTRVVNFLFLRRRRTNK